MSRGLAAFRALADAATTLDALRASLAPGTPAWVALTECVLALEGLLAALVAGDGLEEEDEKIKAAAARGERGIGIGDGFGPGNGDGNGFGDGPGNGDGSGDGPGNGPGFGIGIGDGNGIGDGGSMRQTITISLYFDKGYIGDPYFPAREQLINIQKISGMNRTKSEEKRQQALKDYLQRQGLSQEQYQALEREAQEPWYRNGTGIIIPSHQLYGCLIEACRNASATLRPCDPENLRHVLTVSDLHTGKVTHDGIFQRLVMPKSGTGQPLSNQRALRENPYIAAFTATGTLAYFPEDLRSEGASLQEFLVWAGQRIGVGASRKMGYGRFRVETWTPDAPDTPARRRAAK